MNTTTKSYSYYPGCSAHATAREYDASLKAVLNALDVHLEEISDWNCCGASSAHNLSANLAVGLPARNLALVEQMNLETIAPCAACYNRLRSAQHSLRTHPERYSWLAELLEKPLEDRAVIRSPISVLIHDIGLLQIAAKVRKPLQSLRVVSYYGCLLARPRHISELGDSEHPRELDDLMCSLGAVPCTWSYAVDCCGGALSISRPEIVRRMTQKIVDAAKAVGADLIITACPMCQVNLEMRQSGQDAERLPALYFSEALGLAFGLPETNDWLSRHLVDPRPILRTLELL